MLVLFLLLLASPAQAYYGRHSTEAVLSFHADAEMPMPDFITVAQLNEPGKIRSKALTRLHDQIKHLMGTFQSVSFREQFGFPGALGESYSIKFTSVHDTNESGRKRVRYDFKGVVVFQKEAFRRANVRTVPIKLPLAADRIYALGVKRGRNHCTDRDFNEEEDFWYYWDPDMPGCALADNNTDVVRVDGELERLPNTRVSYPEYDRLYGDNGNGDALDIAVFIGYIRAQDVDSSRPNRHDEAVKAFHYIERDLKERDFELTEKLDHFRYLQFGDQSEGINYLRRFEKAVSYKGRKLKVRVSVLLGDTEMDSEDLTFHHYYLPALKEADILIYDGHSNLGKNFDLNDLPAARFDRSKYQIFFFNGCSTYPYVNGMYFRAKGGTKNTEIITAGLPAFAHTSGPNVMAFMDRFLTGETLSYQKILGDLEASNEDSGTYLVGVKGDEDNDWEP